MTRWTTYDGSPNLVPPQILLCRYIWRDDGLGNVAVNRFHKLITDRHPALPSPLTWPESAAPPGLYARKTPYGSQQQQGGAPAQTTFHMRAQRRAIAAASGSWPWTVNSVRLSHCAPEPANEAAFMVVCCGLRLEDRKLGQYSHSFLLLLLYTYII